jgi:hypothetical protein
MTFIEAFAAGLPVVTTRLGASEEIMDESCGVLVEPGDIGQLANALERLIRLPEAREALASAGPEHAAKLCDAKGQLNILADTLQGLLEAKAALTSESAMPPTRLLPSDENCGVLAVKTKASHSGTGSASSR